MTPTPDGLSILPPLSHACAETAHSGIREVANLALEMPGAIRLEVGQPDFRTPANICEAAKRAIDDGWTCYTPTRGIPTLREALIAKLARVNGIAARDEQITVGIGGVGVIAAAFASLVEPGDEVLLPDPAWPNFRIMCAWTHAQLKTYRCPAASGFQPDVEHLAAQITPRTKLIVINSPNNPTGVVWERAKIEAMVELARSRGVWLLSDECYDQILLDGAPFSPASRAPDAPIISVYTFSKTYAMTGWRLGYAVAPAPLIDTMAKVLESLCSCAATVSQKAAEEALTGPQEAVAEMNAAYRRRRDIVVEILRARGLLTAVPTGAFYAMADVSPSGLDSREFALDMLRERAVAVAPGSAFGQVASGAVRISLASSDDDLREGVGRLCEYVRERGEKRA
ncbi:MAG TPA: pyridoxal phosphate-dependent aminotransferase [Candidatus Dormibacteraeota bacterium]|nr:pyridoxal phosphate-dependent aminotransferase [Candidatus Dormibacteraeota bacterium]